MGEDSTDVTQLLKAWSAGEPGALDQLAPRVYVELRRMAARYMGKEGSGKTLQATALVHEVRLVEVDNVSWQDRAHFFAISANMMRRILVDRARAKGTAKRGSAALHLNLDDAPEVAGIERWRDRGDRRSPAGSGAIRSAQGKGG